MLADKGIRERYQCDRWSLQHSALASIIIVVYLAIPTLLLEISIIRRYAPQLGLACDEEIYIDSIGTPCSSRDLVVDGLLWTQPVWGY